MVKSKLTKKELLDFFENEGFNVDLFNQNEEEFAEIEKWTDGGVDMIITLSPFTIEKFEEYVNDFDIDEQIDFYRGQKDYRSHFTVSESLNDFTKFDQHLDEVLLKLKNK
jgi:hypothetical protein